MRHLTALPALVAGLIVASPATAQTCPQTFSGTLDASSPTLAQRNFRDGVASTCQALKPNPGFLAGTFAHQTFSFTVPGVPRCVAVTADGTGCGGALIFHAVYLGSFDPTDVTKNWLADPGSSATAAPWTTTFSFVSDPAASYVAMVSVVASGAVCPSFGVTVNDCQPGMVVFPASGDYGPSTVAVAASKGFTVYNNGTGDLNVTAVSLAGANPGDFALSGLPALPATIPASGTLAFTVAFTPGAAGPRAGTLTVSGDDAVVPSQVVPLSGVGTWLQATPDPLSFGPVTVGETSAPATVTFTNTSSTESRVVSTLTITGKDAADFALSPAPALPQTLVPGAALSIPVAFAPAAAGGRSAALAIATDDPDAPTFSVALAGAGATATPEVTPATLDFGNQNVNSASPGKAISVKNNGLAPMVIRAASVEGPDAAMFQMALPAALPISIDSGATASVPVTFKPTSKGAKSATATFTIGGVSASVAVPLTGNGTESGCGCGGGPGDGAALLGAALLGQVLLRRRRC